MTVLVSFGPRFILFCLGFAFVNANPYQLDGNETDACFQPSQKATAECLQELIESYYGPGFTLSCPEFPQILAGLRCTGCPWDRLDPTKINPAITREYLAAYSLAELFHEPDDNCSIAKYAAWFETSRGLRDIRILGMSGSIALLVSIGAIVQYSTDPTGLNRPAIFGVKVPEWMFMGAIWILFNIGSILLVASYDYTSYCDSIASNISVIIATFSGHIVLIYYSLCRCRQLLFPSIEAKTRPHPEMQMPACQCIHSESVTKKSRRSHATTASWYAFVTDKGGMSWSEYIRSKKFIAFCVVYGCSLVVKVISLTGVFGYQFTNYYKNESSSFCSVSMVRSSNRTIEISKLILEPLVHVIYSFPASTRSKVAYCVRYVLLSLIAVYCLTLMFLMNSKNMAPPNIYDYLFWRVPLNGITTEITELSHVLAVSIFGLFEPLRYGAIYPRQR